MWLVIELRSAEVKVWVRVECRLWESQAIRNQRFCIHVLFDVILTFNCATSPGLDASFRETISSSPRAKIPVFRGVHRSHSTRECSKAFFEAFNFASHAHAPSLPHQRIQERCHQKPSVQVFAPQTTGEKRGSHQSEAQQGQLLAFLNEAGPKLQPAGRSAFLHATVHPNEPQKKKPIRIWNRHGPCALGSRCRALVVPGHRQDGAQQTLQATSSLQQPSRQRIQKNIDAAGGMRRQVHYARHPAAQPRHNPHVSRLAFSGCACRLCFWLGLWACSPLWLGIALIFCGPSPGVLGILPNVAAFGQVVFLVLQMGQCQVGPAGV